MEDAEEMELTAARTVRRVDGEYVVSLPAGAVDESGLTAGDEVMVTYREDGPVVLLPWAREDVIELFREGSTDARSGGDGRGNGGGGPDADARADPDGSAAADRGADADAGADADGNADADGSADADRSTDANAGAGADGGADAS